MHKLVRGGQLSLHAIRMLVQVFAATGKWALTVFILGALYLCILKIDMGILSNSYYYSIAWAFDEMDLGDYKLFVNQKYIPAKYILTTLTYLLSFNRVVTLIVNSLYMSGVITLGLWSIFLVFFYFRGRSGFHKKQVRGNYLVNKEELARLTYFANRKANYKAYKLSEIQYPPQSETLHTMISGSTGSGKTVLISDLVAQIKARGDRAIIYDKMGSYTEKFYDSSKDIILNPFDERSAAWNLFKEVRTAANFDSIAASFIPIDKGIADPFWTKAARTIFSEVCGILLERGGAKNQEIVNLLLKKDLKEVSKLIKGTPAQAIIDEQSPKTALSVMSVLSTYLKSLKHLKNEGESFSIRDWVLDEQADNCLFITSKGDLHHALMPIISAWLEIAINNMLSLNQSRDRKIWVILDELPSLHYLPSLEQGLAETRQFGGCFVLGVQSIPQLRSRYGRDVSETISSLCGSKIILRNPDQDTARWCSENLGYSEVEEFREGLSYGAHAMRDGVNLSREKTIKPIVMPTEIMSLKNLEGYLSFCNQYPVTKIAIKYKPWPKVAEKFVEASIIEASIKPDDDSSNVDEEVEVLNYTELENL